MTRDDQLTRAERVRLESFAQAVNSTMPVRLGGDRDVFKDGPPVSIDDLFARAEAIEAWLLKAPEARQ